MSQRANRGVSRIGPQVPQEPPHKVSDKSRLLWERYYGPMQAAAASLNSAIANAESLIAGVIVEAEGFTTETHVLKVDAGNVMTIIRRPVASPAGGNGAPVDQ